MLPANTSPEFQGGGTLVGIQAWDKGNNAKFPYSKQSNNKMVLHAEYSTTVLRAVMYCNTVCKLVK
jgi:hypothetical protein